MRFEIGLILQLAIGITFCAGAVGKLTSPKAFFVGLGDYDLIPRPFLYPIGVTLILIEATIAFSHLLGWLVQPIGYVTAILLAVFLAVTTISIKREKRVKCLCFGGDGAELVSVRSAMRIAMLLAAELWLLWSDAATQQLWSSGEQLASMAFSALIPSVLLLVCAFWIQSASDIRELRRRGESHSD